MKKILIITGLTFLLLSCGKNYTRKTIKIWTFWKQEWLQPGITEFLKNNPGYNIEYQQLSWSNGKDKITTAFAGGAVPDIVELGSTWMPEFIEYNSLANIDISEIKKDFIGGFESAFKNNRVYGIPLFGSTNIIIYNRELFDKAGINKVPLTWKELTQTSEKIDALSDDIYGYSIKISGKYTTWQKFIPFVWSNNGQIINSGCDKILINTEPVISAFNYYQRLSKSSYIGTQDSVRNAFYLGKLGMIYDGPGLNMEKNAPKIRTGTFLLPGPDLNSNGVGFSGCDYLSVTERSKYKSESAALILSIIKNNLITSKIKSLLSFHKQNLEKQLEKYPEIKPYIRQLKNTRTPPVYIKWETLMEKLNYAVESVVLNKGKIKDVIVKTEKEMEEVLNSASVEGSPVKISSIIIIIISAGLILLIFFIMKNRTDNTLIFLSPWIIAFLLLSLYPVLFSFFASFTNYNPLMPDSTRFVFIDNFINILKDSHFINAAKNTFIFTFISVAGTTIISLILAVFLNEKIKFKNFFRASYFFPVITSIIVIAMVFSYIYSPFGPLNALINFFGFKKIDFLNSPDYALYSVILMSIWASFGYYMLLFLAALQTIPEELYESSAIDGATPLKNLVYITIPQLRPMILFVVVINTIRSLQVFSEIFIMTGGGPMEKTTTVVYYLYNYGFSKYRMGYASSAAYILFFLILLLTLFQLKVLKYDRGI